MQCKAEPLGTIAARFANGYHVIPSNQQLHKIKGNHIRECDSDINYNGQCLCHKPYSSVYGYRGS